MKLTNTTYLSFVYDKDYICFFFIFRQCATKVGVNDELLFTFLKLSLNISKEFVTGSKYLI